MHEHNFNSEPVVVEYGSMDDETVVSGAAAYDQTEHKQCKFLLLSKYYTFI